MAENPPVPKGTGLLKRKVAGVPVIYLAGGFVAVLAVLAWQMKPAAEESDDAETAEDESGEIYPRPTDGTVVVQPVQPTPAEPPYEDNETWLRKAVAFLVARKGRSPGEAQQAMQSYIAGEDLTYDQGVMRDDAVRELGLPPDSFRAGRTLPRPTVPGQQPGGPTIPPGEVPRRTPSNPSRPGNKVPLAPSPMPPKFPGKNLGPGSTGPYVVMVQKRVKVTPDGKYGPVTASHVKMFQRSRLLPQTGIVDERTWNRMFVS